MSVERKLLYDYLSDNTRHNKFSLLKALHDFEFNTLIGFNECYSIQNQIKENIEKSNYSFDITGCSFLNHISLNFTYLYLDNDLEYYIDESALLDYKDKEATIEIKTFDEKSLNIFNYNVIRFTLYLIYYKHLKEIDDAHRFVQFIEYLSKLDLVEPESNISISNYIDALKEAEQQEINESLFCELEQIRLSFSTFCL